MNVFLIVVSLYGGITKLPMNSMASCETAAKEFNTGGTRAARAYCVNQ